jgi:hypothetical protein
MISEIKTANKYDRTKFGKGKSEGGFSTSSKLGSGGFAITAIISIIS